MKSKFKIIPALDIIGGKCVRLTQGDYNKKTIYNDDPLEVAKQIEAAGISNLHLVDLDGAKSKHIVNQRILQQITTKTTLNVDFGGGIKSDEDIYIAFESGAKQVTCGSIAISNPKQMIEWIRTYGNEKIILGADCHSKKIATQGWLEKTDTDVITFIQEYEKVNIKNVICTDISKDGTLEGTSINLYKEILEKTNINLIASGGISSISDVQSTIDVGCSGVIIGKAIYEGFITLKELSELC